MSWLRTLTLWQILLFSNAIVNVILNLLPALARFFQSKKATQLIIVGAWGLWIPYPVVFLSQPDSTSRFWIVIVGTASLSTIAVGVVKLKHDHPKLHAFSEILLGFSSQIALSWTLDLNTAITPSQIVAFLGSVYLLARGLDNWIKSREAKSGSPIHTHAT